MSQLFDEEVGKYYKKAKESQSYSTLEWVNSIWSTVHHALENTDMIPPEFTVAGPEKDKAGKDKFWYFVAQNNYGVGLPGQEADLVLVSPPSFIRDHDYVVVDYIGEIRTFNLNRSNFRNDNHFYRSLEAVFSPMVIVRAPEFTNHRVDIEQEIIFRIPVIGGHPVGTYLELFNDKEKIIKRLKKEFAKLIPPDSLLSERYVVQLREIKLFLDTPEEGQTFLGTYKGIQLSETPAVLEIVYHLHYVDESLVRPEAIGAVEAAKHYREHI